MRAREFDPNFDKLFEINDDNIFIIIRDEIETDFIYEYSNILKILNSYIEYYNNMSLETREFFRTRIKKEYISYEKEVKKLIKNKDLDLINDNILRSIIKIETARFIEVNTLVNKYDILD